MKSYNELIRGKMAPGSFWKMCSKSYLSRYERCIHIERLIDYVNRQIESGQPLDKNIYKIIVELGYKNELKGENKLVVTNGRTKRRGSSNLREALMPYIKMAQERQERGFTVKEICRIHGISKSDYYNKMNQIKRAGLGDEIPVYTGRYARKPKSETQVKKSDNEIGLVSVGKFVVKIARGDTTITMPSDTSQEIITKFVKALMAC